jgi:glycerol kinase
VETPIYRPIQRRDGTPASPKAVLALDQGTTSSRALLFGHEGTVLGSAQETFTQHYPQPGWVEHDPEDIWKTQLHSARLALKKSGLTADDIVAIGIANQRETCLLWDAETGDSLGNAIVWQCRRTADRCSELREAGLEPLVEAKTGLRLDPYFSATKLEWLLENREGAAELLEQGRLRAGTIDSFLIWRLTGGAHHVTDFTNASRTMLMDLGSLHWDDRLLDLFHIPRSILPRLCPSSAPVAECQVDWLGRPIPIAGVAGDQQAALFGQGALESGDCKNTYGTGCFVLMNVGKKPRRPEKGLLSTVAWMLGTSTTGEADLGSAITYALEGSIFTAGAAVQWLRDGLGVIETSAEIGPLAARASDNGGIYFVPAMTGLGAPYWDPYARGLLIGLTRGTKREHLARATEEAICYQTRAVLEAMLEGSGMHMTTLRVDGGAAADDFLMQLQADLLGIPVSRSRFSETTALGAAALAGLAVGFWSRTEIEALTGTGDVFVPALGAKERDALYRNWQKAVQRALDWAR